MENIEGLSRFELKGGKLSIVLLVMIITVKLLTQPLTSQASSPAGEEEYSDAESLLLQEKGRKGWGFNPSLPHLKRNIIFASLNLKNHLSKKQIWKEF